jgi:hypothetical protein
MVDGAERSGIVKVYQKKGAHAESLPLVVPAVIGGEGFSFPYRAVKKGHRYA